MQKLLHRLIFEDLFHHLPLVGLKEDLNLGQASQDDFPPVFLVLSVEAVSVVAFYRAGDIA